MTEEKPVEEITKTEAETEEVKKSTEADVLTTKIDEMIRKIMKRLLDISHQEISMYASVMKLAQVKKENSKMNPREQAIEARKLKKYIGQRS